jgi:DNA-binding transcriptional MocR family regulator
VEAHKRGLIESHVGRGTFVRASARRRHSPMARHPEIVDLSMNLPPEPDDPELLDHMQDGLEAVGRDLVSLLRYQGFGDVQGRQRCSFKLVEPSRAGAAPGAAVDAPGAHPAILGILGLHAKEGDAVLSEELAYPGARSIATQLGLELIALEFMAHALEASPTRASTFLVGCMPLLRLSGKSDVSALARRRQSDSRTGMVGLVPSRE